MSSGFNLMLPAGGSLLGIGCDLIEVERIHGVLERHGERFLHRVFTEEERAYCSGLKHPHKHYAARWAAKEAVSKTFTTGIGTHLDHQGEAPAAFGYAVFGRVTEGMDVVDKIAATTTTSVGPMSDVPAQPIVIKSATLLAP